MRRAFLFLALGVYGMGFWLLLIGAQCGAAARVLR